MIGCAVVAYHGDKIIAIECAKGRGTILPGGKWEKGKESFVECAKRELFKETGLVGSHLKLIFAGESEEGFFSYIFSAHVADYTPVDSTEGKVVLSDWKEMKNSRFGSFYELLQMLGH